MNPARRKRSFSSQILIGLSVLTHTHTHTHALTRCLNGGSKPSRPPLLSFLSVVLATINRVQSDPHERQAFLLPTRSREPNFHGLLFCRGRGIERARNTETERERDLEDQRARRSQRHKGSYCGSVLLILGDWGFSIGLWSACLPECFPRFLAMERRGEGGSVHEKRMHDVCVCVAHR